MTTTDLTTLASDLAAKKEAKAISALAFNKTMILAALRNANLDHVIMEFDGGGDEGRVETITLLKGDQEISVGDGITFDGSPNPIADIKLSVIDDYAGKISEKTMEDALENLAFEVIDQDNSGWENNEGASGSVSIDVAAGSITLQMAHRVVQVIEEEATY